MSGEADALAEAARNRGLKLVRSRVRTPGKAGYGLFGLTDGGGKPVFGMAGKAPAATADEVADYLRGAEMSDWKASLRAAGGKPRRRKADAPQPKAAEAPPEPELQLREATPADAEQLAQLFALLDHRISPAAIRANLLALERAAEPVLVLARGDRLLAACGIHRTVNPHRDAPVGRITILVVAEDQRGRGLGRQLVEEAERRLADLGCGILEVTSNDRLPEAHAFYRHLGFERTSMRFAKPLPTR